MEMHGPSVVTVFALALGAGVAGQLIAHHLRVPAILPLLVTGVLLGPDVLGVIDPRSLGDGLFAVVELGVAVILFEGGMNLDPRRLRRQARSIRQLVTIGALVTAAGGALASHFAMGWPWGQAILFGVLVIVTGPTVIVPLLRNVRVHPRVASVLESEGVLIDPIGAIAVAVALPLVLDAHGALGGLSGFVSRLAVGTAVGIAGGFALRTLLRLPHFVPEGLETLISLGGALVLFVGCDLLIPQTGILAVTLAGVVVGDAPRHDAQALRTFQEHLTMGMIGVLFVLLAADVRLAEVVALGMPGIATVAILILLVRPLNVAASTVGTDLALRERAFLASVAPRGIVAAAVASLAETAMEQSGLAGGRELRALVFLTIASTVLLYGATADLVARALGVRLPNRDGIAILGAEGLALMLARVLREAGRRVVLIDANPDLCHRAEQEGFTVVFGNGLEERTLARARLEQAMIAVGGTANEEANSLFAREARELFGVTNRYVAVNRNGAGVSATLLARQGSRMLFDRAKDLGRWAAWLRRNDIRVARYRFAEPPASESATNGGEAKHGATDSWTILAIERRGDLTPMHSQLSPAVDDLAWVAIHEPEAAQAGDELAKRGWRLEPVPEAS